jgi:hypothetical protein
MKKKDIVVRLRQTGGLDDKLLKEAADAIEALRKQSGTLAEHTYRLRNEKQQLIAERDWARRAVCRMDALIRVTKCDEYVQMNMHGLGELVHTTPEEIASERKWDCFGGAHERT